VSQARTRGRASAVARSDDALLREVQAGDLGALGELYDRHSARVSRAIHRTLGSAAAADADDVLHGVFLKLPALARSYDGRPNAGPWLIGIGVRTALRHRRGAGRFFKMLASFALTIGGGAARDPEQRSSDREELRLFEAALASLAPKKRAVFTLVELEGLTTDEVARALETPAATVRTRLHHARRELAAALPSMRSGAKGAGE
jgi:RNA polymerase sigma-70 factor (ECF subfamily)